MSTIIRLTAGIPKINAANPQDNLEEISLLLSELPHEGSDIIVLPRWGLTSPECGSLFLNDNLLQSSMDALEELAEKTKTLPSYLMVGLAGTVWGEPSNSLAVLYRGQILSLLPCSEDTAGEFREENIFAAGSLRFGVLTGSLDTLTEQAVNAAKTGCELLLFPLYSPMVAGEIDSILRRVRELSLSLGIAIGIVNGGIGGSSSPYLYRGFAALYECGERLFYHRGDAQRLAVSADLDLEIIRSQKRYHKPTPPTHQAPVVFPKPNLLRPIRKNPFLPEQEDAKEHYLAELFSFQVHSLALRMENTGLRNFIVGVSGGLDSTSALLVSLAACEKLGLPRENVIGITQPGMGTSDRTYFNALAMMEAAGITYRDVSIRPASQQQFEDIGHGGEHDTTYENVQARERSQMLLNIANMEAGLVVGSGDLSEEALGFSTFGGDHLANYNVNACLPKTVMREMLWFLVGQDVFPELSPYITEALETPVSPELLPPDEEGNITQKTEDILGPYELHDFFLYHFVKYNMRPSKIYHYACIAFADSMSSAFIKEKLSLFLRKFCAAQFKRSCAPDAASITEVNLLGVSYQIPSDLDPSTLLADLQAL